MKYNHKKFIVGLAAVGAIAAGVIAPVGAGALSVGNSADGSGSGSIKLDTMAGSRLQGGSWGVQGSGQLQVSAAGSTTNSGSLLSQSGNASGGSETQMGGKGSGQTQLQSQSVLPSTGDSSDGSSSQVSTDKTMMGSATLQAGAGLNLSVTGGGATTGDSNSLLGL